MFGRLYGASLNASLDKEDFIMAEIIVVASQKGGVGKTTTTANLGISFAASGKKVLVVDFDPSANLTAYLTRDSEQEVRCAISDLMDAEIECEPLPDKNQYIYHYGQVDFIGSNIKLSTIEAKMLINAGAERTLSEILDSLRDMYDYILIDTNPSLGILSINALTAADKVLIVASPQSFSLQGLNDLLKSIVKIRKRVNAKLEIAGVCITMCDKRTKLYKRIYEDLLEYLQGRIRIYSSMIPYTVKVGEAIYYGKGAMEYYAKSPAGQAYADLAKEMMADE